MDNDKSIQFYSAASTGDLPRLQELSKNPEVNINLRHASEAHRTPFDAACRHGNHEIVEFFLGLPGLDCNLPNSRAATPFYIACQEGHTKVVSLLMADPRIDVNHPADGGETPFFTACSHNRLDVVLVLMADSRIDVNQPTLNLTTSLWMVAQEGRIAIAQYILASKNEVDTMLRSSFNRKTAAEHARTNATRSKKSWETEGDFQRKKTICPVIADLIDDYGKDPGAVRKRLRRELRLDDTLTGELFALVVFLSDGFLKIPEDQADEMNGALKFFSLSVRLPMDLQMVLCNRVFGLGTSIVKALDSEEGFRKFAKGF